MAKRSGPKPLPSPARSARPMPAVQSSSALSGPITTAEQAESLLKRFPNLEGPELWPQQASEDHLALQLVVQQGGVANPQRPLRLQPQTLEWLDRLAQLPPSPSPGSAASQSSA